MGCGSSKRTAVMPVGESEVKDGTGGGLARRTSELPPIECDDPPAEQLREDSVNSAKYSGPRAQPLAFEVPVSEESIIRKHPPKRFQRLEDQQVTLSHELLDEKQEEAKQRRFQILSQRVQSAKRTRRRFLNNEDENNH
ncbi:hypothetical protein L9F63_003175, partial [Diploptera punctata]